MLPSIRFTILRKYSILDSNERIIYENSVTYYDSPASKSKASSTALWLPVITRVSPN